MLAQLYSLSIFHIHHDNCLLPSISDLQLAVKYKLEGFSIGGVIKGGPVVNLFLKRPIVSWSVILNNEASLYRELTYPNTCHVLLKMYLILRSGDGVLCYNKWDESEVNNRRGKEILSKYFDIITYNGKDERGI